MGQVKAAVLVEYEKPLEVREYPRIEKVGPGEVLVRVELAGICGTDVHLWLGQLAIPLPVILGHEAAGRVEVLGEGLSEDWRGRPLAVGDRVTWASSVTCGSCYYCRQKNQPTRCVSRKAYGISYCADEPPHLRGGYAEYILLRAGSAVFRLPGTVPAEAVVGAGCALVTAIHGIERTTISWGDVVVIQGTGPVGLAALAIAKEAGASRVIAIGGPKHRLDLAREFGAHELIDIEEATTPDERLKQVLAAAGPFGADVVIECVGRPAAVNEGMDFCRDGGKLLVLGQYADAGTIEFRPHTITRKQIQLIGSWGFEPRHVHAGLDLLERSGWKDMFASEITHRFGLSEANEALATTREWRSGKTVIQP